MSSNGAALPIEPYISVDSRDRKNDEIAKPVLEAADHRLTVWLVQRAIAGEKEAFGDLYRLCFPAVARVVGFHLQGAAREDAIQETFVRAWSALGKYRDTGAPFSAWLIGIARHVVGDAFRAAKRVQPCAEVPEQSVTHELDDGVDLARAVAQLPDSQRQVIELKFLLGWSNEMVANALGKTPGAINVLQFRALQRMRKLMDR